MASKARKATQCSSDLIHFFLKQVQYYQLWIVLLIDKSVVPRTLQLIKVHFYSFTLSCPFSSHQKVKMLSIVTVVQPLEHILLADLCSWSLCVL